MLSALSIRIMALLMTILTNSESSWQLQTDWLYTCLLCILSRSFCNECLHQNNQSSVSWSCFKCSLLQYNMAAKATQASVKTTSGIFQDGFRPHLHDNRVLDDLVCLQLPDDRVNQLERCLQCSLLKFYRLLKTKDFSRKFYDF